MNKLLCSLSFLSLLNLPLVFAQGEGLGHGGGNGGDDLELELKKRSLQIASFVKSSVGAEVFHMINADSVINTVNNMDIDVVSGNVIDKFNTLRTCVNEADKQLITCNLDRINELRKNRQDDILTGLLFHEILGLMGLELGYQDNVSMYPISSKIIPYYSVVSSTPIEESHIRPEYFGLKATSYGITLVNRKTKESIRMICLNDNVEIHRCRNFSVVRRANEMQAPLIPELISFHLSDISLEDIELRNKKAEEILNLENDLSLVGKEVKVKDSEYKEILESIKSYIEPAEYLCTYSSDCRNPINNKKTGLMFSRSSAKNKCNEIIAEENKVFQFQYYSLCKVTKQ
jgi:hypothetical protein